MNIKKYLKYFLVIFFIFSVAVFFFGKRLDVADDPQKADLIVSLGGGYEERLLKAIELYHKDYADKIVFTGHGIGLGYPGDELGFWKTPYFEERGVAKKDIYFLDHTGNTYQEVCQIKKYMKEKHYGTVLIVSDPPHSKRIKYMINICKYEDANLSASVMGSDVKWWDNESFCNSFRSLVEAAEEMLGVAYYYIRY